MVSTFKNIYKFSVPDEIVDDVYLTVHINEFDENNIYDIIPKDNDNNDDNKIQLKFTLYNPGIVTITDNTQAIVESKHYEKGNYIVNVPSAGEPYYISVNYDDPEYTDLPPTHIPKDTPMVIDLDPGSPPEPDDPDPNNPPIIINPPDDPELPACPETSDPSDPDPSDPDPSDPDPSDPDPSDPDPSDPDPNDDEGRYVQLPYKSQALCFYGYNTIDVTVPWHYYYADVVVQYQVATTGSFDITWDASTTLPNISVVSDNSDVNLNEISENTTLIQRFFLNGNPIRKNENNEMLTGTITVSSSGSEVKNIISKSTFYYYDDFPTDAIIKVKKSTDNDDYGDDGTYYCEDGNICIVVPDIMMNSESCNTIQSLKISYKSLTYGTVVDREIGQPSSVYTRSDGKKYWKIPGCISSDDCTKLWKGSSSEDFNAKAIIQMLPNDLRRIKIKDASNINKTSGQFSFDLYYDINEYKLSGRAGNPAEYFTSLYIKGDILNASSVDIKTGKMSFVIPASSINAYNYINEVYDNNAPLLTIVNSARIIIRTLPILELRDYKCYTSSSWSYKTTFKSGPTYPVPDGDINPDPDDPLGVYIITTSAGEHGTVSPLGVTKVKPNGFINISYTADRGYRCKSVCINGKVKNQASPIHLTKIDKDYNIHVSFEPLPDELTHNITVTCNTTKGIVNPMGEVTVNNGENVRFTFLPNDGCELYSITQDGVIVCKDSKYTSWSIYDVRSDHTLEVLFTKIGKTPDDDDDDGDFKWFEDEDGGYREGYNPPNRDSLIPKSPNKDSIFKLKINDEHESDWFTVKDGTRIKFYRKQYNEPDPDDEPTLDFATSDSTINLPLSLLHIGKLTPNYVSAQTNTRCEMQFNLQYKYFYNTTVHYGSNSDGNT